MTSLIKQVIEDIERQALLERQQVEDGVRLQLLEEGETLTEAEIRERVNVQLSIMSQLPPNIVEESKKPGFWSEPMSGDELMKKLGID